MYAKVFASLWDGSLRGKPNEQLVLIYLLAHADEDGVADIIPTKIADDTGLNHDQVAEAIISLCSPDPNSRSQTDGGRVIATIRDRSWGWQIVNYQRYRDIRRREDRKIQNREAKQRQRASADVSNGQHESAMSAKVEVEVEAEEYKYSDGFDRFWDLYPKKAGKKPCSLKWKTMCLEPRTDEIVSGLMRLIPGWTELKYVPNPLTFLNQERWMDEPAPDPEPESDGWEVTR